MVCRFDLRRIKPSAFEMTYFMADLAVTSRVSRATPTLMFWSIAMILSAVLPSLDRQVAPATPSAPALTSADRFGCSIAEIADIDGDGIPELAIGDELQDRGGERVGCIHILGQKS